MKNKFEHQHGSAGDDCGICGDRCPKIVYRVHFGRGATGLENACEHSQENCGNEFQACMGYYPVGAGCWKKHPEIRQFGYKEGEISQGILTEAALKKFDTGSFASRLLLDSHRSANMRIQVLEKALRLAVEQMDPCANCNEDCFSVDAVVGGLKKLAQEKLQEKLK